jgi:hypothetical protein
MWQRQACLYAAFYSLKPPAFLFGSRAIEFRKHGKARARRSFQVTK